MTENHEGLLDFTADSPGAQPGDFRIGNDGQVLVFDGDKWQPYKRLPDAAAGSVLRTHSIKLPDRREEVE